MDKPVAFRFFDVILVSAPMMWDLGPGMSQFINSISDSIMKFSLLSIPLYILMGEFIFYARLALDMIRAVDLWIGKFPGDIWFASVPYVLLNILTIFLIYLFPSIALWF